MIYLGYLAVAARQLGAGWEADRLSFLDVTVGSGHLYALRRELRAGRSNRLQVRDAQHCALFATVPGEDHGIGITIATDLFREAGREIDLQIGIDHEALIAHVEQTEPQIIGLSLHTDRQLDALVRLVVAMRFVVQRAIIGVAPGVALNAARVQRLVDVDLMFTDARSACVELDRIVRLRG